MITQDEIDWILQLAEDELSHLKHDAESDPNSVSDYRYSKDVFERVREHLTTEGRIKPW